METEDKKAQVVPANMEEAVAEFMKARQERIAIRRARIAEKIAETKNAEGQVNGDTASIPSSLEFLAGLGEKSNPDITDTSRPQTFMSNKRKSKLAKAKKHDTKKQVSSAAEQLDLQIEESRKQLEQMILDGEVLITNVKVAAEYREKVRQNKQDETYKDRLERLRQESDECQNMYGTLSQNWSMKAEKVLPMDLYKQMKAQQDSCDELLLKKDELITAMRREIEENDFEYEVNLEKYQKDGMLMGDRIDDLVDDLRVAFVEELNLIEDYTCRNREVILEDNQNEWMDLLQQFESMEQKNLDERKTEAVAKFQTLNELFTTTKQEARNLRNKMEDDLRILIQEREQIKYACHINLEKMAYNLHILQCRSKENVELKNMMKRFLLQLHDKFDSRATNLKKKMEMGKRQCDKLMKEIERLETQVSTFGNKTLHLALSDHKKYIDLWVANEELIRDKVKCLLGSEKFVYETQLGIEFQLPDMSCFDDRPEEVNKSLRKRDPTVPKNTNGGKSVKSRKSSMLLNDDFEDEVETVENNDLEPATEQKVTCAAGNTSLLVMPTESLEFLPGPEPDPAIQRRLMKSIGKVICDQSGFIVEEELQKILDPLLETERNLVNLDAVLQSLGITNMEEMQTLAQYMLKYCKVMKGAMSKMGSEESAGMTEMNVSMEGVIGKAALEDQSETSEFSISSSLATPGGGSQCGGNPTTYCECASGYSKKVEAKKHGNGRRSKRDKPQAVSKDGNDENKDGSIMPTVSIKSVAESCGPVCCTPPDSAGSVEQILEEFESDGELEEALESNSEDEEEENDDEPDCSFVTNQATVMSWLDIVDREKIIENLSQYKEELGENDEFEVEIEEFEGENDGFEGENEEFEGENDEFEEKHVEFGGEYDDEEYEEMIQPVRKSFDNEEEDQDVPVPSGSEADESDEDELKSNADSKTISIPSHDSSSDASDEFLFINSEDVITALKNFCEDYNDRQKVVLPTAEEIISRKLAKIKYPVQMAVGEYWENAINLLDPKGKDLWDTVQYCFDQYNQALKERNEHVADIAKLYQQNYELSHLLQKHLQSGTNHNTGYPPMGPFNPGGMGYC